MRYDHLTGAHDLTLPDWGPYSKRFFGISHITDRVRGDRFDFTVIPGIYRRELCVPDALRPSGYLPWRVAPDLEAYSYRQQIEWRDRLFCDIGFFRFDEHTRIARCRCVNRTERCVDFALHFLSSLVPEPTGTLNVQAREWCRPHLRSPRGLVYDCKFPGERRLTGTVRGSAYTLPAGETARFFPTAGGCGWLRAQCSRPAALDINGRSLSLPAAADWCFLSLGEIRPAEEIRLRSDGEILIDGLAVTDGAEPALADAAPDAMPRLTARTPRSAVLEYPGAPIVYGVKTSADWSFARTYAVENFNDWLLYNDYVKQSHFGETVDQGGKDCHCDMVVQPLPVAPQSETTVYAVVADGNDAATVAGRLAAAPEDFEAVCAAGETRFFRPAESPHAFSQERMAAVTLTNVVYPTYISGGFVRHHTPGRCWNSLYTWDSGFIGLGLLEISRTRAEESLNAYLTPPGDSDSAFVHHGSPVPVQIYLFNELLNRGGDREFLEYFYPRLKQYYEYLAGRVPGSLTRTHCKEDLICTWDYFYNSGGWDDYPPQHAVHARKLLNVVPVVGTAHLVRCAKILRRAAEELGESTGIYDEDIARFGAALQKYAYDPETGYFSYTVHDKQGNYVGIFRHPGGENYNRGLDGAMPLVAGCATPEQRGRLWDLLASPEHCWSAAGLSTVDRSAAYFRNDGYWNGSVWMPYQWFFWKAALNDGRGDFAWRIAETALKLWENEVRESYACYEQFAISSGRGSGWHHFSALSAPVLNFASAYYTPGRLTAGYDVAVSNFRSAPDAVVADLRIDGKATDNTTLVAVVAARTARVTYAGREVPTLRRAENAYEFMLPCGSAGRLEVRAE